MSNLAEPLPVAQFDARELGRRFAARRRRIGLALILAGLALVVGGFAAFDVYANRADALQKHGVHTTATVTGASLFGGGRNGYTEHIDVSFATPSGVVQGVRIPIGENDRFTAGQQVAISYDPGNPRRAVFAHGYVDPGPIGFVFFLAIVTGGCALVYALRALRLARRAHHALENGGRMMKVEGRSVALGRGLFARTALVLDNGGDPSAFWVPVGSGRLPAGPVDATVYWGGTRGSVAVVAYPEGGTAVAGRIWRRRRV